MSTGTVRLHSVIRAPADRILRAFIDPDAMSKWLPPNGYSFGGKFVDLIPGAAHSWRS